MIVDCGRFEEMMDAFEAGTLSVQEREAIELHLSACARCRVLHENACGRSEALPCEWQDALAAEILRRTSGPVCSEAELHLCSLMDDNLGVVDREFLELHLSHCRTCSALAASLRELREILPEMASVDPGDTFTAEVLQATTQHTPAIASMQDWWRRIFRRPRFAWEAAYVGALLVLFAIGNPAPFIQRLPAAFEPPTGLILAGDPILRETSDLFAVTQAEARLSLNAIRMRGRTLAKGAVDVQHRTAEALFQKTSTLLEELRANVLAAEQAGAHENKSR